MTVNEFDQFEVDCVDVGTGSVRLRHLTCRQNVGPLIHAMSLSRLYRHASRHMESCPALRLHGIVYDDGDAIEFPAFTAPDIGFAAATRQLGASVYLSHLTDEGCPVYRLAGVA